MLDEDDAYSQPVAADGGRLQMKSQLLELGFPEDLIEICVGGAEAGTSLEQLVLQLSGMMVGLRMGLCSTTARFLVTFHLIWSDLVHRVRTKASKTRDVALAPATENAGKTMREIHNRSRLQYTTQLFPAWIPLLLLRTKP